MAADLGERGGRGTGAGHGLLRVIRGGSGEVVERGEEGDEDDGGDEEVEEDGEGGDFEGVREGVDDAVRAEVVELEGGGRGRSEGAKNGEPAEGLAGGVRSEAGFGHHDNDAGDGEDELGKQGEGIGGHLVAGSLVGRGCGLAEGGGC